MQKPITIDQLPVAVAKANERFRLIRQKYPNIKAYLVFSSGSGQVEIGAPVAGIIKKFPAMFISSDVKSAVLDAVLENLDRLKDKRVASQLQIDGETQIELRFVELNYELIWKLQADELVDQKLTPCTKASIRIVLGTLDEFASI